MGAGVLGHEQRSFLFFRSSATFTCEFFVRPVLAGNGSSGCERGGEGRGMGVGRSEMGALTVYLG